MISSYLKNNATAAVKSSQSLQMSVLKKTLILFAPLFLLILLMADTLLYFINKTELKALKFTEQHTIHTEDSSLRGSIVDMTSDLTMLVNSPHVKKLWDEKGVIEKRLIDLLGVDFMNLAMSRRSYNQIRLLDENGMEAVRVNFKNGVGEIVTKSQLENKKGRYYFDNAFELKQGEVFLSPLDLNIKNGQIEQPLKPMLRLASPVFDQYGHKRGIILLNYFGSLLMDHFSSHEELHRGSITMLLNAEGYWLKAQRQEDEWGFMYEERKNRRIGNDYPDVWEAIRFTDSNQVQTDAGLFTVKTVYPLLVNEIAGSSGSVKALAGSAREKSARQYHWKLISFIPASVLNAAGDTRNKITVWILIFLSIVIFIAAWFAARVGILHKQAEEKSLRFSRIIEDSQNEIYIFDSETLAFEEINQGALNNLGYTREEMDEKTALDINPKFNKETFVKLLQPLCSGEEKGITLTTVHQRKDGSRYPVEIQLELLRGEISVFVAFIIDITERLKTDETLSQAKMIVESSRAVLFRWRAEEGWPVEMVSENVLQFGYSPADFISGKINFAGVIHKEDVEGVRQQVEYNTKNGIDDFEQEYRILSPAGEVFWIDDQTIVKRNADGKVTHYQGIAIDITGRKKMEDELRKLAQAVEQSPESIVITNLMAEIEYVNETFIQKTGYQRQEVLGQNPRVLQSGKTSDATYREMWDCLAKGQLWKGEFSNKRKDGSEYIEFVHIAPIRQADGSITHYLALKEDITEKKKLGNELDRYRHHLEEMVNDRTRQLLEEREKAEAANLAKSTFLANMSHEIRTPMNAILGLTHLLQLSELSPDQLQRLKKISVSANDLLAILNNILDLSKIEADKLALEQIDFQLNSIFDKIQSLLSNQADEKGLTIHLDPVPGDLWLNGDATRLRQALLNYAGNAIKFTEHGGITLRAKILEEADRDLLIRFEVEDTGIGIKTDQLDRLFDSFEQADLSTTRKYGGTGLGLAITRSLAQLMGGEAGANSKSGIGSTFWFTARLKRVEKPVDIAGSNDIMGAEHILRNNFAGSRILLVEDNEINLEVALELLKAANQEIDFAMNGREAVGKVVKNDYDVILMDVQMPEMDGLEATRVIRLMDGLHKLPIIAMTANVFEEDKKACLDAGMNDFVTKPVNSNKLFSTLIKWLPAKVQNTDSAVLSANLADLTNNHESTQIEQPPAVSLTEQGSPVNLQALQGIFGDDQVKHLKFLQKFVAQAETIIVDIESAVEKQDLEQIGFLGHKLKSSARAVGADEMADLFQALEFSAKGQDLSIIKKTVPEVAHALSKLKHYLNSMS